MRSERLATVGVGAAAGLVAIAMVAAGGIYAPWVAWLWCGWAAFVAGGMIWTGIGARRALPSPALPPKLPPARVVDGR